VVVLRRPLTREKVAQDDSGQRMRSFIDAHRKRGKEITGDAYAVLVTNPGYEILRLGPLYRDRAEAENAFDELKNQWGWGGFTTHDLARCQITAQAVALIYNWWRPEPYNKNVGGAPGRHPFGTSVDVRMETMSDMETAFVQLCKWRKAGELRAVGYYGSTALHFGIGDHTGNTWGKDCP
jgi:hypothetical protein